MSAIVAHQAILAHQGGWDEFLLVAGPIAIIIGLLKLAKKRVAERAADHVGPGGVSEAEPGTKTGPDSL